MDFCDDVWSIIKEFAGIYNLSGWNKIEKIGVGKLHDFYKEYYHMRITNYLKNAKLTKTFIFKKILPSISLKNASLLLDLLPKKEKKEINALFKVGDEVATYNYCGIVIKVGIRLTIQKYGTYSYDQDPDAFKNQTPTYRIYKYNRNIKGNKTVISCDTIKYIRRDGKVFENEEIEFIETKYTYSKEYFVHWKEFIDYGR